MLASEAMISFNKRLFTCISVECHTVTNVLFLEFIGLTLVEVFNLDFYFQFAC